MWICSTPCFSRTQFLPNPTILEWEISSKSPNVLLEDLEVNLWINLGLFAIAMPRIRLFVGDIWSHCPSLYSDFQPTLGAVKRSDLGRILVDFARERLMNQLQKWRFEEKIYGVSADEYRNRTTWIWWNLMNYILFVPVLFGITVPNWPLCF